jgi:hypothetical protein
VKDQSTSDSIINDEPSTNWYSGHAAAFGIPFNEEAGQLFVHHQTGMLLASSDYFSYISADQGARILGQAHDESVAISARPR